MCATYILRNEEQQLGLCTGLLMCFACPALYGCWFFLSCVLTSNLCGVFVRDEGCLRFSSKRVTVNSFQQLLRASTPQLVRYESNLNDCPDCACTKQSCVYRCTYLVRGGLQALCCDTLVQSILVPFMKLIWKGILAEQRWHGPADCVGAWI